MKRFLAVQNIVHFKKRLEIENDPKRRAIIERLLTDEEALLLLDEHKLSGKMPDLVRSPDICGGPTPRLAPSSASPRPVTASTSADFDHRRCPDCEGLMRLAYLQPHALHRDDGYDVHHYRCENCLNSSRFVLERRSDEDRPATFVRVKRGARNSRHRASTDSRSSRR